MSIKIALKATFSCSVERAFQAPILGDATKFLNGYRFQPPITAFEDDATWGKVGGHRYPVTNGNFWMPKGRIFTDKILTCQPNKYWKWTIYDFQIPLLFFAEKAIGEWEIIPLGDNRIGVRYCYEIFLKNKFYHLFADLFVQVQWKGMMKKALKGIQEQAEGSDKFVYSLPQHTIT